ncbi:hypothetical protein BGY98DRAFT_1013083 [Russula aff. rugulosa BPL654]|nr:hypothetical protein BGY98DRAFT_1013083 [Russula aff. rugulosa BPL654]
MSPWSWYERWGVSKSPSSSPSHESNQSPPAPTLSDPGPSGSYSSLDSKMTESDPGPSRRPYSPSDSEKSTSTYPPLDSGQPTWARLQSDPGPEWPYSSLDSKQTESDPGLSRRPFSLSDSEKSTSTYPPSDPGQPTWARPQRPYSPSNSGQSTSSDPVPLRRPYSPSDSKQTESDPGLLRKPYSPLGSKQTKSDPVPLRRPYSPSDSVSSSDSGPSPSLAPHPLPSPLQQHESESVFSDLFRGRFKRRISDSRFVNGAHREFHDTLDSKEYVSALYLPSLADIPTPLVIKFLNFSFND